MTPNPAGDANEFGHVPLDWDESDTMYRWEKPLRVFLAEDDGELRQTLAETLRIEGYDVSETGDGSALESMLAADLQLLGNDEPTVIVTDVRLPGQSGIEILRQLRQGGWRTPVLLMTAFGNRELTEEASRLGVSMVLSKPFSADLFLQAIRLLSTPNPSSGAVS